MKSHFVQSVLVVVWSVAFCSFPILANTYYVSPSGNDLTGDGTLGNPWRTLRFALDSVYPGDVLYLRGGVYNEQFLTVRDGAPGNYITVSTFNGEDAYVDGTGVVTGNNGAIIPHSYLKLIGFTLRNWPHAAMEIFDCEFIELRRLKVTNVTGGIHLTGTVHDFVVDSCIMYDYYGGAGGFGFDATPEGATDRIYDGVIQNSKAYLTAGAFDNCDGFALGHDGVSNISLYNCEVYGVGDGFDISGAGIRLERCAAYNSSYGGGYKLWRDSVTLINCIGFNNSTNVELDFDAPTNKGVKARLINCTFFGSWNANIFIERSADGSTLEMYNCILAGGDNTGLTFDGDTISCYTGDFNVFHMNHPERTVSTSQIDFSSAQILNGEWTAFSGQDAHTKIVFGSDSLFVDTLRAAPDIHLKEGSVAINNGTNLPDMPLFDFDNCPRNVGMIDIGAYEFGACGVSGIRSDDQGAGDSYHLQQNYPNPFNPATTIAFTLPYPSFVTLKIFDLLGRDVATLVNETASAGWHSVQWDAAGRPSGVYFYTLRVYTVDRRLHRNSETKKLVLLR